MFHFVVRVDDDLHVDPVFSDSIFFDLGHTIPSVVGYTSMVGDLSGEAQPPRMPCAIGCTAW
jgi:hypothetical protein